MKKEMSAPTEEKAGMPSAGLFLWRPSGLCRSHWAPLPAYTVASAGRLPPACGGALPGPSVPSAPACAADPAAPFAPAGITTNTASAAASVSAALADFAGSPLLPPVHGLRPTDPVAAALFMVALPIFLAWHTLLTLRFPSGRCRLLAVEPFRVLLFLLFLPAPHSALLSPHPLQTPHPPQPPAH